jgi:hypothetical protein
MTIGLTWRRTARRIKRLKEGVLTIFPDYSDRRTPDFLALSNKIRIKSVTLGRDFGTKTEILSGLGARDRVVQNPADDLHEGMPVSIQSTTQGTQDKAANSPTGTSVAKEQ